MEHQSPLARRAVDAALVAVARSLRIRGFVREDEGFSLPAGGRTGRVRIDAIEWPGSQRAGLEVWLEVVEQDGTARVTMLWDLVPGRERGGAWTVTPDSEIRVVVADLVAALERYGVPHFEPVASESIAPSDRAGPFGLGPVVSRPVGWREPVARRGRRTAVTRSSHPR